MLTYRIAPLILNALTLSVCVRQMLCAVYICLNIKDLRNPEAHWAFKVTIKHLYN